MSWWKRRPIIQRPPPLDPEIEARARVRWSSSSERITGLTSKILAVNVIALMILGLGLLYMGQYTDSLIAAELDNMRGQARFYSGALSEGAVRTVYQVSPNPYEQPLEIEAIRPEFARRMVRRLGEIGNARIRLYAVDGSTLADSHMLRGGGGIVHIETLDDRSSETALKLDSLFAQSATRFLDIIPMKTHMPAYPAGQVEDIFTFADAQRAMVGNIQASAWKRSNGRIVVTAAAPIQRLKQVLGVVILERDAIELERSIASVRVDVFRVFLVALGITVMLSIYLSGLIGRPLQRLAAAAEVVRRSKTRSVEIPDMSHRRDEIGELSVAMREMTQALWDRMDAVERFAADVAHELKNPLTSLRSAVETASKIDDPAKRKKLMDIVQHDIQRLDRLISDISSASRLDAELSREEMGTVELAGLLQELQSIFSKPLERADGAGRDNIRLDIDAEGGTPLVVGNRERLGQVFTNLIGNALSFSPEGSLVTIKIKPAPDDKIRVTVEDEGPGIPDAKLENVFERFYTERPSHESYGQHSGLGLSIAKQIVDAHGGAIWAENIRDIPGAKIKGARFTVELERAA